MLNPERYVDNVIDINTITVKQINSLNFERFTQLVDIPQEQFSQDGINNLLTIVKSPQLSDEKKLFLLDKLGFLLNETALQDLIDLYHMNAGNEEIAHMILRNTQAIYQNNAKFKKNLKTKKLLRNFYQELLNEKLNIRSAPIVVRGFIFLSSERDVLNNTNKINTLMSADSLDLGINLSFKNCFSI